jgi:uncharacterized membrane protein YagU involved in acid resistance
MSDPRSDTLMTWVADMACLFVKLLWLTAASVVAVVYCIIAAAWNGSTRDD